MPLTSDQIIAGKYRLKRHLARGGMGAVWQVEHVELGVDFALKVLRAEVLQDAKAEARFRREARAAAQLKSPHVVQVHDFGVAEGVPYLVMEFLTGEDLDEYLERCAPLTLSDAIDKLGGACRGLSLVHDHGLVHRDIKPSNLFLSEANGTVTIKLLDFGIAKPADGREDDATTQGLVLGSPAYMSPEQARGGIVDPRSDLWSLGAVFYRMLTGRCPFEGTNPSDLLVRICTEDVTRPSKLRPELGPSVDQFFTRALARDPAQRFQSAPLFWEGASALLADAPSGFSGGEPRAAPQVGRGRMDETAPLPAVAAEGEPRGEDSTRPGPKPFFAPWVWVAVAALLGVVLWLGLRKSPEARDYPEDASRTGTHSSVPLQNRAQGVSGTPKSALDSTMDDQAQPGADAQPAAPAATRPTVEPSAPQPARAAPKSAPQAAPRAAQDPKKPQTDPMFGLPVESP